MARGGFSERLGFLRRRIAALEGVGAGQILRPEAAAGDPLQPGPLSEILPAAPRDAPVAAALAFALAARALEARPGAALAWIVEDMSAREIGLPYGRGLAAAGLDPSRLALIRTRRPRETFEAMEEALRSRAGAVVAESWETPGRYDLLASRRLLLAARRGGGVGLLVLPRAAGAAQRFSTAAEARFEAAAAPPQQSGGWPCDHPVFRLRIVKNRAAPGASADPNVWRDVAFDPQTRSFHALSRRPSAASADRPAAEARRA